MAVAPCSNPSRRPLHPDVTLSTGRVIRHRYQENGSQFAFVVGDEGAAMTSAEWDEYCSKTAPKSGAHLYPNADCASHSRENLYHCDGSCSAPVCEHLVTKRWYITMGHSGFNSPTNNGNGYASKSGAIGAMCRYAAKGSLSASLKSKAISRINARQQSRNRFLNVSTNDVAREMASILSEAN